ncbi:MAG: ASPIC/UnbV domain-containing protein, partial [Phycisphaerae bacterium]
TQTGRPAIVLRNDQDLGHHWLRIKIDGVNANSQAIGAQITAKIGDQTLRRQVMPTRSYFCQSEIPVVVGLGQATMVDELEVRFPDGHTVKVANISKDRTVHINPDGMLR